MRSIENYIICFFVYCFVGWLWETIPNSYRAKKFVNRGFLNGPVIPIYGVGALLVYFILGSEQMSILPLFLASGVLTVSLEYFTSWAMEKLFHARWWDYSNKPFNINGRIYLTGFIAFGAFSVIVIKWAQPSLMHQVEGLSSLVAMLICLIGVPLFIVDLVLTVNYTFKMTKRFETIEAEIDKYVTDHNLTGREAAFLEYFKPSNVSAKLDSIEAEIHNYQAKRLIQAFPQVQVPSHQEVINGLKNKVLSIKKK